MAVKDDYQDFKNALNDLKINSKPIINFLTILAEEKMHNAQQIVHAIEERIFEVCIKLFDVFLFNRRNQFCFVLFTFYFSPKVIMFYLYCIYLIL